LYTDLQLVNETHCLNSLLGFGTASVFYTYTCTELCIQTQWCRSQDVWIWNPIWMFTHSWYGVWWQQRQPYMTQELRSTQTVSEETRRKKVALYGWELKINSPTTEAHLLSKTKSPSYLYIWTCVLRQKSVLFWEIILNIGKNMLVSAAMLHRMRKEKKKKAHTVW